MKNAISVAMNAPCPSVFILPSSLSGISVQAAMPSMLNPTTVSRTCGVRYFANHTPHVLDTVVGLSMLGMAAWTLIPDKLDGKIKTDGHGAFMATLIAFFIAEIGDKTQIATAALAAGYSNLLAVVAGTTTGMMLANVPVVLMGSRFAARLPMNTIHKVAAALFAVLGLYFIARNVF